MPQSRSPAALNLTPLQMLQEVRDWGSYVAALEQCDEWWGDHPGPWSVLGDHRSWRETVEVLHDVVGQQDWGRLGEDDLRRLLGLAYGEEESWALLGRMRPSALNTVFGANQEKIQDTVLAVIDANSGAFPQLAFEAYETLWKIPGVGEGIATRLLTLARPDRFVSLNGASRNGLAEVFSMAPSTLGRPRNYSRLLTAVYSQQWCSEPTPRNGRERAFASMRTALLDCFVYDEQFSSR